MENPDIDRPAVHIGFPFFAALFVASFFGAFNPAFCRRFGSFAVRRRFSAFSV